MPLTQSPNFYPIGRPNLAFYICKSRSPSEPAPVPRSAPRSRPAASRGVRLAAIQPPPDDTPYLEHKR